MLKSYFTTAVRAILGHRVHSAINIAGLTLGVACCVLIALFIRDELTFDRFHTQAERIFRVYSIENSGQRSVNTCTPLPMGPALKDNLPEVERMTRFSKTNTQVRAGEHLFSDYVAIAAPDFLGMFDFEVARGTTVGALADQAGVVLTERIARKYFGEQDPLGKTLAIQLGEQFYDFTVTAVLKDPPSNSSIRFRLIISDLNYLRTYSVQRLTSSWFQTIPETYVQLREGVDPQALSARFPAIFKPLVGAEEYERTAYTVGLQPLTSIHLDADFPPALAEVSNPRYSYILGAMAVLILAAACINFITLSIGRSLKRAREVAVRKVAGAQRRQLILQFIAEAMIVTAVAVVAGLVLSALGLPLFNGLSGKQLVLEADAFLVVLLCVLTIVIGLFAGSYPAFVLSGFRPALILKGTLPVGGSRQHLRQVLVGVQLVLSIGLIAGTLLMRDQLQLLQHKDLGFDREQLVVVPLHVPAAGKLRERILRGFEKAEAFKTAFAQLPQVSSVCVSSHDFGDGYWVELGYTDDQAVYRTFSYNTVDEDYLQTLQAHLVAGRNFSKANPSDQQRAVIVNEAFVKVYGWDHPIGQQLPGSKFEGHEVIGVVKDFHFASLYTRIAPLALAMDPGVMFRGAENMNFENSPVPKLLVRLRAGDNTATLHAMEDIWKQQTGGEEFNFSFADQTIDAQYKSDHNLGKIVSLAAALAIAIGSLGLYGLASLAMQSRTKEISIRKVLGATEQSLLVLLSRDYVYLVGIALAVSVPLIYYAMDRWLATFQYRIDIGAGAFLIAGGVSLLIALLTISYQAIRTAGSQPAQTLRKE